MLQIVWDLIQQGQIARNQADAQSASGLAVSSSTSVTELRNQLDTLVLANQAMWEILSERLNVSDAELVTRMNEIDLRDGKLDGKLSNSRLTAMACPECGKTIGKRRANCYWCGARVEGVSPFKK
ncbi:MULTISPECIES: hypothetical protein [Ferrimonas]|uniref:hypothetical protein n=1 Tax=Ferrimonas TaxID=44011 RepID=UPI000409C950|nr:MULTISPECIES: hypothetical protein [Ferrimonas]USD35892.1 hypothetical protein J8Z22_12640 [Ferrimonas sp. SCSIO 43195]